MMIWIIGCMVMKPALGQKADVALSFDFYGETINISTPPLTQVSFQKPISASTITHFYEAMENAGLSDVTTVLLQYRKKQQPDDWMFYQLIRSTAENLSPKADDYERYTLYKWYFLLQTGYDALLAITPQKMLLYVQSPEEVFEIPFRKRDEKQYVCLNYHDYSPLDFSKEHFSEVRLGISATPRSFTYKITKLPQFQLQQYTVKEIQFDYYQKDYHFKVLVNEQVQKLFANYPVVDYRYYFEMPLSPITYGSLIPLLKDQIKKMNTKKGVDYLMRFTRYAFPYASDTKIHGREKRLTPEQTLLYEYSDCEDRAAFFFYLVKEIYNLPMIVLQYPDHITVAVQFDNQVGNAIVYKGQSYTICEATPQRHDLRMGQAPQHLRKTAYEVVYEYQPSR